MRQNRNKGMAFISVVIAIMFIGLLATSLTYMAYSNYISKSTRWQTSEHFYYDEYALDELASALRQKGTEQSSIRCSAPLPEGATPLDPTKVLIEEMAKAAGVTTDNGDYNSSATGTWNATSMTNLVRSYGMTNNSNIEVTVNVSTIPGRTTADYVRNKKDIKFCNVQITILDKRNDYKTVITTDIHIPAEPKGGSIPVNEFSLMTDSPFKWDQGGMVTFQGNLFCMDAADPPHTGVAMEVKSGTNLTMAGKQSLIVGDLYVRGNSIVSLGGATTITGTVHVEEGSIVDFRGSDVRIGGLDNSGMVTGFYDVDSELTSRANSVFDGTGTYSAGLASAIADDVTVIVYATNASDAKTVKFCKTEDDTASVTVSGNEITVAHPNGSLAAATYKYPGGNPTDPNTSGSAKTQLRPLSTDITGASDQLLFMTKNPNGIRGDYSNTTMICTATTPVQSDDESTAPYMTKLNDQAYNDCLNTWVNASGSGGIALPGADATNIDIVNFNTGKFHAPTLSVDAMESGTEENYIKMPMDHLGKEERWMFYNTSTNSPCVPWGYFIRDDADDVIGFAFSNVRDGDSGGSEMKLRYENWVKE